MKIQHPGLLWTVGWGGAALVRAWMRTLRLRVHSEDPAADSRVATRGYIYCLWHETLLLAAYLSANRGIHVLVSQSGDGEYISRIIGNLGYETVRGSSTRGALRAVRELARSSAGANLGITPDGPRGPRRVFQEGAVYVASRTGLALVPMCFAFERPWRAASWDRFVLPRPFTRATMFLGSPITVPREADAAELARYRQIASDGMTRAEARAEQMLAEMRRAKAA